MSRFVPDSALLTGRFICISWRVETWALMLETKNDLRAFLAALYRIAVDAAHPAAFLPRLLPPLPSGRVIILAAGKAAGSMAEVAEKFYLDELKLPTNQLSGVAVARHGYGRPVRVVSMVEAGHPVPDAAGLKAAERALELADGAGPDDLVLVLMSGGASANWIAPADGVSFADKQAVTRALLRSGAHIGEINTVRRRDPVGRARARRP